MLETKIRKGTFQHVEAELYAYHDTKKEIIRLRNEIMNPFDERPEDTQIVKGKNTVRMPSDPTGSVAVALVMDRRVEHLEKVVRAIENVYVRLPEEKQKLIKVKYWTRPQMLAWEGIAQKLNCNRATAFRWRDEIIFAIADIMGWR